MRALFARIRSIFRSLQLQRLIAVFLVGVTLLTTSAASANLDSGVKAKLRDVTTPDESGRPRTTRQWQEERDEVEGQPLKRLERIAEESADAVENMAEIYPQNAKTLTPGVDNGRLPRDD